jgi:energy-coupling factor transport system permease protein
MNATFGKYLPYNSFIHRLDPRIKIFSFFMIMITCFFNMGYFSYILIFLFLVTLFIISLLPFRLLFNFLKPILFITLIFVFISAFFDKNEHSEDEYIFGLNFHKVTWQILWNSIYTGFRITLMIIITTMLTVSTKPLDMTLALEDLMKPLKLIKFPVHIFSMIISLALRSIPILFEEGLRIINAQASRGVDFKNGKLREKVKALVSLIVPLLISSFQKAEDLSFAMETRGYDPLLKRTRFRFYRIKLKDFLFLLLVFLLIFFLFENNYHFFNIFPPFLNDFLNKIIDYLPKISKKD